MKVIVPGGSGFLGRSLSSFLEARGYEVIVLTRHPERANDIKWDGKTAGAWCEAVDGSSAIVNMTGRSVNCVYNDANKREIIDSRIDSVKAVQEAVEKSAKPTEVIVQVGSLAIYGDTSQPCDEKAPHGEGFSVQVCQKWEEEFFRKELPRTRKCVLRTGFVLGPNGGALVPLRNLTKWFLGGTAGGGNQYISWLHIDDLNRMILACIEDQSLSGVFNATGPHPVTNREFMKALRKVLKRPWSPPAPSPLVRFGARYILKTDGSLVLTGRKCFPKRFEQLGFEFKYVDLESTLEDVMSKRSEQKD